MTLKKKHISLAQDSLCLSPFLEKPRKPWDVEAYADEQLEALGYRYVYKRGLADWKVRRMSMALRRQIRWGVGFRDKPQIDRARDKMHELAHARQYRVYRSFLARYITDPRFRWAMEAQAYRESARALRSMGVPPSRLRNYINGRAETIIRGYFILGLRLRRSIRKHTAGIVSEK